MTAPHRELRLLFLALSCGPALAGLAGCGRQAEKASTQDLASRIESAGDDERGEIVRVLRSRGKAAIPEILQAFQKSDKPVTQMVLADSVARMPRSEEKKAALKKMQELTRDANVKRTLETYLKDPR
jgi:hypothetical protein